MGNLVLSGIYKNMTGFGLARNKGHDTSENTREKTPPHKREDSVFSGAVPPSKTGGGIKFEAHVAHHVKKGGKRRLR